MTARTLVFTALLFAALAAPASATDFPVTVNHDDGNGVCLDGSCTLRDALEDAGAGDRVLLPADTYELVNPVDLEGDKLIGAGARTTIIVGPNDDRVVHVRQGTSEISGVTITGGSSPSTPTGVGGGIVIEVGSLSLIDSTVVDNEARQGGGIANLGTLTVVRSTITGNRAFTSTDASEGGGIYSANATTVRNSTISGNSASSGESTSSEGGGVLVNDGSFTAHSTTIARNVAPVGSAIYSNTPLAPIVTLSHTIIESDGTLFSCIGGATFQSSNTIVNHSSCGGPAVDPQLAELADNGGPTDTQAIASTSPAANAGTTCDPTDQRGVARVGPCDIGAYESSATAQPGPGPGPGPQPPPDLPDPEAGKNVNVTPNGTVKIKVPGSNRFVTLTEGRQLPIGTIVDTPKGSVTIEAAGNQFAKFYDGIFKIGQGKGAKPLTTLTLVEKLSCPSSGKASAAAKGKKKRRLWGDGKGRFQTKGKHSAATVVGTKWLVEDRCKSTLTKVAKGRVSVRDFVLKKTVIVRAGKTYVARAKTR